MNLLIVNNSHRLGWAGNLEPVVSQPRPMYRKRQSVKEQEDAAKEDKRLTKLLATPGHHDDAECGGAYTPLGIKTHTRLAHPKKE